MSLLSIDPLLQGEAVIGKVGPWHFDKRDYSKSPPRNLSLPPKGAPESVVSRGGRLRVVV